MITVSHVSCDSSSWTFQILLCSLVFQSAVLKACLQFLCLQETVLFLFRSIGVCVAYLISSNRFLSPFQCPIAFAVLTNVQFWVRERAAKKPYILLHFRLPRVYCTLSWVSFFFFLFFFFFCFFFFTRATIVFVVLKKNLRVKPVEVLKADESFYMC